MEDTCSSTDHRGDNNRDRDNGQNNNGKFVEQISATCVSKNPRDDTTKQHSEDSSVTDKYGASVFMPTAESELASVNAVRNEISSLDIADVSLKTSNNKPPDVKRRLSYPPHQEKSEIELLYAASLQDSMLNGLSKSEGEVPKLVLDEKDLRAGVSKRRSDPIGKGRRGFAERDGFVHLDDYKPCLSFTGDLTLDQLPDDVLFHIATFLDARVVRFALSQVCQRFRIIFDNEAYWKRRITVRWRKRYPPVASPRDFQWADACVEREDNHRIWSDYQNNTQHFMYGHNVYGTVDAVHLMGDGRLVVSGDRNRLLNFIDLSKYPGPSCTDADKKAMLTHTNRAEHKGWIWSITSVGNRVVTGSWDTNVRVFDVDAGCQVTSSFKCRSAVLSLYAEDTEIVAGCFDKKVYFMDTRTSNLRSRIFHTKPVLCVTGSEKFIISGSEDKSISIYDRRAGKIFMMFKLDSYPLCLSYEDNQLWFGDRNGRLNLHDGTEGVFQYVGSYDVGHTGKMTGLIYTRGAIYTCSGDKTMKVLHPTQDPDTISTLDVHQKEIASMDYKNGVLVSAGGDDSIGVWLPKYWDKDTYLL